MTKKYRICDLSDLPEYGAKGYTHHVDGKEYSIIVALINGQVFAYINRCPHTGVNLDWMPNEFLDVSGQLLQCATHGALFRMDDGFCVHGPCVGRSLSKVEYEINNGAVHVILP